jgi:hypothetical protein
MPTVPGTILWSEVKAAEGLFTDDFFTKGPGIGSELFRIQLQEDLTGVPVTLSVPQQWHVCIF